MKSKVDSSTRLNIMVEVWIYAHWLSCNLGDRHQGRTILRHARRHGLDVVTLARLPLDLAYPYRIVLVNFSPDTTAMSVTIDGLVYPVYSPDDLSNRCPDLIVVVTGSIDYQTRFMPVLKHHLSKPSLQQVIMWGGFCHGDRDGIWRDGLAILGDPRVDLWSRSWRDADLYERWFGRPSRLGGDPIASCLLLPEATRSVIPPTGRVVIMSVYASLYHPQVWDWLAQTADRLISIDPVADAPLGDAYPRLEWINDPDVLIPILRSATQVIAGRLHGGLLSALIGIPTAMVVTDDASPGMGTYKFEAVARTGPGRHNPICSAPLASQAQTWDVESPQVCNRDAYLSQTQDSLDLLMARLDRRLRPSISRCE